jgi:hypothetical protein
MGPFISYKEKNGLNMTRENWNVNNSPKFAVLKELIKAKHAATFSIKM